MKQTPWTPIAFAATLLIATGCPSDPEVPTDTGSADTGGADTDVELDAGAPDSGDEGEDAGTDADVDATVCEPRTECPVDACGQLDDGCGGQLDCGVCDCVDGVPTEPTCGQCGLGAAACDAEGTLSCTLPRVPDIENLVCNDIIHVDLAAAGGLEDGTRFDPYVSLSDALVAAAADPDKRLIVVTQEGPLEEGFLSIPDGVSIVGGYTRSWLYTSEKTQLVAGGLDPSTTGNEHYKAIAIASTKNPVLIEGFEIEMRDALGEGVNAVGISIYDAAEVVLDRVRVTAGNGSTGRAGTAGDPGTDGLQGDSATEFVSRNFVAFPGENSITLADCPSAIGGDGGKGGTPDVLVDADFPALPQNGMDSPLGAPGGLSSVNSSSLEGARGESGNPGAAGANGALPSPFDETGAFLYRIELLPGLGVDFQGIDGADGRDGRPGQGGGGGGGARRFNEHDGMGGLDEYGGGSGGAGGHGGCGGEGGIGGQGGGASIALLVSASPNVTVLRSVFTGGTGGVGGRGSLGGAGGTGGLGGRGTFRFATGTQSLFYQGGDGGAGGEGGSGGAGAAGHGGHSFGALCDVEINLDSETIVRAGLAGAGGRGLQDSDDGLTFDDIGCTK